MSRHGRPATRRLGLKREHGLTSPDIARVILSSAGVNLEESNVYSSRVRKIGISWLCLTPCQITFTPPQS